MEKITAQTGPLAFIGGGAMTEAIIKGILEPDWLTRVRSLSASRQRHAVNIYRKPTALKHLVIIKLW